MFILAFYKSESLFHLLLPTRRLLHGRTELDVLILLLHLLVDLLNERSPLGNLASASLRGSRLA